MSCVGGKFVIFLLCCKQEYIKHSFHPNEPVFFFFTFVTQKHSLIFSPSPNPFSVPPLDSLHSFSPPFVNCYSVQGGFRQHYLHSAAAGLQPPHPHPPLSFCGITRHYTYFCSLHCTSNPVLSTLHSIFNPSLPLSPFLSLFLLSSLYSWKTALLQYIPWFLAIMYKVFKSRRMIDVSLRLCLFSFNII